MKKFFNKKLLVLGAISGLCVFSFRMFSQGNLYKKVNRPGIVYWHGDPTVKKIALTFDDGPNEPYTSEILEVLKKYNVRATFFLIGKNVDADPSTAKAIVDAGHVIGNHSYSHPNLIFKTTGHVKAEIERTEDAIEKATGQRPKIFRPPFGGDDPFTFSETKKLGYVVVKWSVSARDWERPGAVQIYNNIMRNVHNGSIILMHDGDKLRHKGGKIITGGDRSQTVRVLPGLIAGLRKQGYDFVTIPELLGIQ